MKCLFCSYNYFEVIFHEVRDSRKHSVVRCGKCELYQLSPIPTKDDDKKFYDEGEQFKNINEPTEIKRLEKNQESDTQRRANFVSRMLHKKSSILDVGSGFGFFLREMILKGYEATGIEVSAFARNISRNITVAQVLDVDILYDQFSRHFDAVTLFHVLEHIREPVKFLINIKMNLNKKGHIIIEVPNVDDLMLEANKYYRNFYWQRAHLSYFNAETIIKVIKRAGFSKYKIYYEQRYGLDNFMNWMATHKPQIKQPSFSTAQKYKWLEDYYRNYLIKSGKSDTLIVVLAN